MNGKDDSSSSPDQIQPWTDPELEARIVALVLGEASDFEREELERLVSEQPELRLFKERMEQIHGLLRPEAGPAPVWQISGERRTKVLEAITSGAAGEGGSPPAAVPARSRRRKFHPLLTMAAGLALLGVVVSVSFPKFSRVRPAMVAKSDEKNLDRARAEDPAVAPFYSYSGTVSSNGTMEPEPLERNGQRKDTLWALQEVPVTGGAMFGGGTGQDGGISVSGRGALESFEMAKNEAVANRRYRSDDADGEGFLFEGVAEREEERDARGRVNRRDFQQDNAPSPAKSSTARPSASPKPPPPAPSAPKSNSGFPGHPPTGGLASRVGGFAGASVDVGGTVTVAPAPDNGRDTGSRQRASGEFAAGRKLAEAGRYEEARDQAESVMGNATKASAAREEAGKFLADLRDTEIYSPALRGGNPSGVEESEVGQSVRGTAAQDMKKKAQLDSADVLMRELQEVEAKKAETSDELGTLAKDRDALLSAVVEPTPETSFYRENFNGVAEGMVSGEKAPVVELDSKLRNIVIPEVNFEDTPVEDALAFLQEKARELDATEPDPEKRGLGIVMKEGGAMGGGGAAGGGGEVDFDDDYGVESRTEGESGARITLNLTDVPLDEALRSTTELARLKYRVDPHAVVVESLTEVAEDLETQAFEVPPHFLKAAAEASGPGAKASASDPFADPGGGDGGGGLAPRQSAKGILENFGMTFPDGSDVIYDPISSRLIVRNNRSNLDLMESMIDSIAVDPNLAAVPPMPAPIHLPHPEEEARQVRLDHLRGIIVPRIDFEDVPLKEAVARLRAAAPQANLLLDESLAARDGKVEADLGFGDAAGETPITLKLVNVPLIEAVRYLAELGRLSFRVDPDAVRFVPTGQPSALQHTSIYQVPPEMYAWIKERTGPAADASTAREMLESVGISFPEEADAAYDPERGRLVVRNTGMNFDLVEAWLESVHVDYHLQNPAGAEAEPESTYETSAAEEPFSTFSLHVSDVSFKLAYDALSRNEWPGADSVRIEEFINAFDYGDPSPGQNERVACRMEQAIHPDLQQRNLLRVSLRTAAAGRGAGTPLRLTILLDKSGSMERPDRRATVVEAFRRLAELLREGDKLTLISFSRQPRLLAERYGAERAEELVGIVAGTPSEGGTNLESALVLAMEKAREQHDAAAQNRIVLLTDGAANLGDADPERLAQYVNALRQEGIAFDAAGIGSDGLNDTILEALTRKGDGRYYLLDSPADADAGFARQLAGAFRPAAKNVKVQIEFNPDRVGRYRLLGFEEHRLEKEDFRNDAVDAAELAAEEAGVAVYQVEPLPGGTGDLGSVSVRFLDVATGQMVERRWPISHDPAAPRISEANPTLRIAGTAGIFAAKLKGDPAGERASYASLARNLSSLPPAWREAPRVRQLQQMIAKARELAP